MEGKRPAVAVMVLSLMLLAVLSEGSVGLGSGGGGSCKEKCEKKCSNIDEGMLRKQCVERCLAGCRPQILNRDCRKSCVARCSVLWAPGSRYYERCLKDCLEGCN